MQDTRPQLLRDAHAGKGWVQLRGRWSAAELAVPATWKAVASALNDTPAQAATGWNLEAMDHLDHMGAQLLWNHWGRAWPARVTLSADQRSLYF